MPNHPIHLAARRGDLEEVQRLVTDDPSLLELRGEGDYTPLMNAALQGHAAIVEWLLDHAGADIEAQDRFGRNMLYVGIANSHLEVVSILLNRGADVNRATGYGWSPLIKAAEQGHGGIVKLLLSQEGINLDAQNQSGYTALSMASDTEHEEVILLLLAAGADPRIERNDGMTPLDIAQETGHNGCIRLLEDALAAPERARLLHRARAINDAHHAIEKTMRETEGRTRGERKRKMIAAAPAYLKRRVEEGRMLPHVEIMQAPKNAEGDEKEKLAAAIERMVMGGQVPTEGFVELMGMMIPRWDNERRRE